MSKGAADLRGSEVSSSLVYTAISEQVACGELEAGKRLPPEGELSAQYGVSVHHVRKALRKLKANGLVYSQPRFGVYVGSGSSDNDHAGNAYIDLWQMKRPLLTLRTASHLPEQMAFWNFLENHISQKFPQYQLQILPEVKYQQGDPLSPAFLYEYGVCFPNYYTNQERFYNIGRYYSNGYLQAPESWQVDGIGIPVAFSTTLMLMNVDLLHHLGFSAPAEFATYSEQLAWMEEVTLSAAANPALKKPSTCQAVILRLGQFLPAMYQAILKGEQSPSVFVREYTPVVQEATAFWQRHRISDSPHCLQHLPDFQAGHTPFLMGFPSNYIQFLQSKTEFRCALCPMLTVDNRIPRLASLMVLDRECRYPAEALRIIKEMHSEIVQERLAIMGLLPLSMDAYSSLPYSFSGSEKLANPLQFQSQEEHYVCLNILNIELWNIILAGKAVSEALADGYALARAYLEEKLDTTRLEAQRKMSELYN
ncbi:MAG: GntR family transcriptional regulator [Lentisphaeria bacterium]|nr:GntR family transcriptional regulator [Lentisphaeria bacterium]